MRATHPASARATVVIKLLKQKTAALLSLPLLCAAPAYPQTTVNSLRQNTTLLEAVQSTLSNHPLLQIQDAQVEISRGRVDQATGAFDTVTQSSLLQDRPVNPLTSGQLQQNALSGILSNVQTEDITNYGLSAAKLFRNGIRFTPSFQMSRITDNLFNSTGVNNSTLGLVITIPLLRGRGRTAVAADEEAAKREADATAFDLDFLMSQLLLNTANSYWNLVAADKNLAIALETEDRGKTYLEHVKALVAADHVPANDLNEATANLAERTNNRIAAEQQCTIARQQLAIDMGLKADGMLAHLPTAVDDFPTAIGATLPSNSVTALKYYFDRAMQLRADYLATQRRDKESKILVAAAANRLQPQLDLNFGGGYTGLKEGRAVGNFFASSYDNVRGPNSSFGITYSFFSGNHAARGAFRESTALSRQSELQTQQVARSVSQQLVVSVEGVRNAILRANQARDAVDRFQLALEGEREKYRAGMGSLLDILTVEDRLTRVLSDQVQAQSDYALALTQFRFATGTLINPLIAVQNVPADTFLSLPFTDAPGSQLPGSQPPGSTP